MPTMPRVVAYDLTRLFIGPLFATPRGIDRVDLALARHIFADPDSANIGILPTPWGVRAYPSGTVRTVLDHVLNLWSEHVESCDDPLIPLLVQNIRTGRSSTELSRLHAHPLSASQRAGRMIGLLHRTGLPLGRAAERAVPRGSAYLNVGQLGLAVPWFHNWLGRRTDVAATIMLHDVIPLEYPQLVRPSAVAHHHRMVQTAAKIADSLLFNSEFARDSVNAALLHHGRTGVRSFTRALPLPAAYCEAESSLDDLHGVRYFLVVSTIERRKNHELLFRAWERLLARQGKAAPHLVIVGSPGFGAEQALAALDNHPLLRSRVHLLAGLSSKALAALVLGATGMLCPSLAEGFGLPLLEANALGVPAIASNIAAHREVATIDTILLPSDDDQAWAETIATLPTAPRRNRPEIGTSYTEEAYCRDVLDFVLNA